MSTIDNAGTKSELNKNYHDNRVYLKLKAKIRDQQQFNSVISNYQNHSGGYEIVFCQYDCNNDVLEITYRCNKSKQIVLNQNPFSYDFPVLRNYNNERENFPVLIDSLIVESSMEISYIRNYVKMLLVNQNNNNRIKRFESSDHFINTYYFQFLMKTNFKDMFSQHQKNMNFNRNIKFYRGYQTFLVLASLNLKGKIPQEVTQYLNKVFQKDDSINWQSFNDFSIIPYVIVIFSTIDLKRKYLCEAEKLLDSYFIVSIEDVLNVHLLNKFIELKNTENLGMMVKLKNSTITDENSYKMKLDNKSDILVSCNLKKKFKSRYKQINQKR